jgi:uncharacterized protein YndB with AHSA1/START domain
MTERTVIHDTFVIERTYPATPSRSFAAFASEEAKNSWGDTGDLEPADGVTEFDFRVSGRERFSHRSHSTVCRPVDPAERRSRRGARRQHRLVPAPVARSRRT